jgi:chitin disaccharide deacetylase
MSGRRYLIVNADDFGMSPGVNRGIIEAHERGIVTSASLMVRWFAAKQAAAYAGARPHFSIGLHIDLGEWAHRDGEWTPLYEVVSLEERAQVEREVALQLASFRDLLGRNPTHLDSHQHVHRAEPVRAVLVNLARDLDIPLRHYSKRVRYCGDFYGQTGQGQSYPEGIEPEALIEIIKGLPHGITELGSHPGFDDDLVTIYRSERAKEVHTLCDPAVKAVITQEGIELISFSALHSLS